MKPFVPQRNDSRTRKYMHVDYIKSSQFLLYFSDPGCTGTKIFDEPEKRKGFFRAIVINPCNRYTVGKGKVRFKTLDLFAFHDVRINHPNPAKARCRFGMPLHKQSEHGIVTVRIPPSEIENFDIFFVRFQISYLIISFTNLTAFSNLSFPCPLIVAYLNPWFFNSASYRSKRYFLSSGFSRNGPGCHCISGKQSK